VLPLVVGLRSRRQGRRNSAPAIAKARTLLRGHEVEVDRPGHAVGYFG
jgi:hypothetical protein